MSHFEQTHETTTLSNAALDEQLQLVEGQERVLSTQRRLLHTRIDNMKVRSDDPPEFADDLLASLQREEREVSKRRLEVHQEIAELRMERSRRLAARPTHLSPVD